MSRPVKSSHRNAPKLKTLDFSFKTHIFMYSGAEYHHVPITLSVVMWVSPSGMDMDGEKSKNFATFLH